MRLNPFCIAYISHTLHTWKSLSSNTPLVPSWLALGDSPLGLESWAHVFGHRSIIWTVKLENLALHQGANQERLDKACIVANITWRKEWDEERKHWQNIMVYLLRMPSHMEVWKDPVNTGKDWMWACIWDLCPKSLSTRFSTTNERHICHHLPCPPPCRGQCNRCRSCPWPKRKTNFVSRSAEGEIAAACHEC